MIQSAHLRGREALDQRRRSLTLAGVQAGVQRDLAGDVGPGQPQPASVGPVEGIMGQLRAIAAKLPDHRFHAGSLNSRWLTRCACSVITLPVISSTARMGPRCFRLITMSENTNLDCLRGLVKRAGTRL